MSFTPEEAYRNRIEAGPERMVRALEYVLPADASKDDAATTVTRQLCFGELNYGGTVSQPFSERVPVMLDHGVRQVALATEVLDQPHIREQLPSWFNPRQFARQLITADVGLSFVPQAEIQIVLAGGPRYMHHYLGHPEYGYGAAMNVRDGVDPGDADSRRIAQFAGRHHAVQARNQYGITRWYMMETGPGDETIVDLSVTYQKPFDYADDSFARKKPDVDDFATQIEAPIDRFMRSSGSFLCNNLMVTAAMLEGDLDTQTPNNIARELRGLVLDEGSEIHDMYRHLRPDLEVDVG